MGQHKCVCECKQEDCKHERVRYCKDCKKVHCEDCGKVWYENNWTWMPQTYPAVNVPFIQTTPERYDETSDPTRYDPYTITWHGSVCVSCGTSNEPKKEGD